MPIRHGPAKVREDLLKPGEFPCQICGAGISAHNRTKLGHPFPPPPWLDWGYPPPITLDDLNARGFFGRLKWALFDR